jgi:hypothetical protein
VAVIAEIAGAEIAGKAETVAEIVAVKVAVADSAVVPQAVANC